MTGQVIETMSFTMSNVNAEAMAAIFDIPMVEASIAYEPHLVRGTE